MFLYHLNVTVITNHTTKKNHDLSDAKFFNSVASVATEIVAKIQVL